MFRVTPALGRPLPFFVGSTTATVVHPTKNDGVGGRRR